MVLSAELNTELHIILKVQSTKGWYSSVAEEITMKFQNPLIRMMKMDITDQKDTTVISKVFYQFDIEPVL